ncbi:MAG TPA: hypothetical protein VL120_12315 [Solirubrobacteraceae bacterium]|nr:hypothetical protein [Solirubrobacteraceae bacterium]
MAAAAAWSPGVSAAQGPVPPGSVTADFTFTPLAPLTGEVVTFASVSTATGNANAIVSESWDLDGDGVFGDATGPVATATFGEGAHVVRLRVVDGDGAEAVATQEVAVAAPAGASAAVIGPAPVALLTPFPVVRIVGAAAADSTNVRLITITGPPDATVVVRCRRLSCPFTRRVQQLPAARGGSRRGGATTLRIVTFAGGPLLPGTWIQVFVIDPLRTGKYTRFIMRRRRPPDRLDRCTAAGREVVVDCPGVTGAAR